MAFLSSSIKKVFLFVLITCFHNIATGQLKASTIGSTSDLGGNCFQITPDEEWQVGGVWFDHPIDFSNDFIIAYQNYFGDIDKGGDGMAIVFKGKPEIEIGDQGSGLGYRGISSSLIVEFDTYQNIGNGDPWYDHVSLMANGNSNHNNLSNLAGPIDPVSNGSGNIEDGVMHDVKIEWNAAAQTFSIYFDCIIVLSKVQDFNSTIFNDDDSVYFGFVGATGSAYNLQEVCIDQVSFIDEFIVSDEIICLGEFVEKDVSIPNGVTYSWSPTLGVSNPNSANTFLSPMVDTTYTVTITDECGFIFTELVNISIEGNSIVPTFNAVPEICEGESFRLPETSIEGIIGNWFPEPDNTKTTEYTFFPDPGQCATLISLVVEIPSFDIVDNICEGDILGPLPILSNEGIVGSWSPELNNQSTTIYTFTPDSGRCTYFVSKRIEVYSTEPLEMSTILLPDSFSENRTIKLEVTGGSGFYEYQLDGGIWQSESVFEKVSRCSQHDVGVRDVYSCVSEIREAVDLIFYPKFFTPNGDGYHDSWNIQCLEAHPEAVVFIYNRHGALLKQIKPSHNGWDGTYRGTELPDGSYWFVAHYRDESNKNKQLRGYFALKR